MGDACVLPETTIGLEGFWKEGETNIQQQFSPHGPWGIQKYFDRHL